MKIILLLIPLLLLSSCIPTPNVKPIDNCTQTICPVCPIYTCGTCNCQPCEICSPASFDMKVDCNTSFNNYYFEWNSINSNLTCNRYNYSRINETSYLKIQCR